MAGKPTLPGLRERFAELRELMAKKHGRAKILHKDLIDHALHARLLRGQGGDPEDSERIRLFLQKIDDNIQKLTGVDALQLAADAYGTSPGAMHAFARGHISAEDLLRDQHFTLGKPDISVDLDPQDGGTLNSRLAGLSPDSPLYWIVGYWFHVNPDKWDPATIAAARAKRNKGGPDTVESLERWMNHQDPHLRKGFDDFGEEVTEKDLPTPPRGRKR